MSAPESLPVPIPTANCINSSTKDMADWFKSEVYVHDSRVKSYVRSSFPSVRDVGDVVQDSYLRVWKARLQHPIHNAKAFLFEVVRHVAVDFVRHQKISPIQPVGNLAALPVIAHQRPVVESLIVNEKLALIADAIETLPARGQEVVVLRKLKNLSRQEVAERLAISKKTVDEHLARGIKKIEQHLRAQGVDGYF